MPPEVPDGLMNAGMIAALLDISQQNVHKWVRRRGIEPVDELPRPVGKVYSRTQIEEAKEEWEKSGGGPGGREADARRRASALKRIEDAAA